MKNLNGREVLKRELNANFIKSVVMRELRNLRRTSFSDEGFSDKEVSAIAEAISAAIAEYDHQRGEEA